MRPTFRRLRKTHCFDQAFSSHYSGSHCHTTASDSVFGRHCAL